jgi:hypothetical protein
MKLPLLHNRRYTPLKGTLGICVVGPLDGCTSTASLRSSNTTLAIMLRVLRFEASWRPVTTNWSDRFHQPVRPVSACQPHGVFVLGFVAQPSNLVVLWWTTVNPANLVWPPTNLHSWLGPNSSRLDLGFEAQPRNHPRLRLAVLATLHPALDPAGHWVPRTKPTCLLHTWRSTGIDLSRLFFTCTNTNQAATCTRNT